MNCSFQRVDKVDTLVQTSKSLGIFCEIVFVGVRGYGRERFRKKQVTPWFLDETPVLR